MSSEPFEDDDLFDNEPPVKKDDDVFLDDDNNKLIGGAESVDDVVTMGEAFGEPLRLMPVSPGKGPLEKWADYDSNQRYKSSAWWREMWSKWGAPNPGIICGRQCGPRGRIVVEADNVAGEEWCAENLPETPTVVQSRRGWHRHYPHTDVNGERIRNAVDVLGSMQRWLDDLEEAGFDVRGRLAKDDASGLKGASRAAFIKDAVEKAKAGAREAGHTECPYPLIDVRADGGYVVAPGARHKSGHVYVAKGWNAEAWAKAPKYSPDWFPARYKSRLRARGSQAKDIEELVRLASRDKDGGLYVEYQATLASKVKRARAYAALIDPAIEGQGGHGQTFYAACKILVGFDLPFVQAYEIMQEYNARCVPPWEDHELDHKLLEADACASEPRGCHLVETEEYARKVKARKGLGGIVQTVELLVDEDDAPRTTVDEDDAPRTTTDDGAELTEDDKAKSKIWKRFGIEWLDLKSSKLRYYLKQLPGGGITVPPDIANLVAILHCSSEWVGRLRYNELLMMPELDGKPMEDHHTIDIEISLSYAFRRPIAHDTVRRAVEHAARLDTFDPVLDYLRGLTWDQEPRLHRVASELMHVEKNIDLASVQVRRWFISAVARIMEPGCKVDTALILKATQGAKKSTFFAELFGKWFTDTHNDISNKDGLMALGTCWCWEWGELQNLTNPKLINTVKAFLASQTDKFRTPYGRKITERARRAVVVGSTNEETIVYDPTGSRRLWIIEVRGRREGGIDLEKVTQWRDQLWAEALYSFSNGEQWWLTKEEDDMLEHVNQEYQPTDVWFDKISKYADETVGDFSIADVLKYIGVETERQDSLKKRRVKQVLDQMGCKNTRRRDGGKHLSRWSYDRTDDLDI